MNFNPFNYVSWVGLAIIVLILCLCVLLTRRYIFSLKSRPCPPKNPPPNAPAGMVLCPLKSRCLGPSWTAWWQLHFEAVYIAIPFHTSLPKLDLCHFGLGRCWQSLAQAPQGSLIYSNGSWMPVREYLRLNPPVDDLKKAPVSGWRKR